MLTNSDALNAYAMMINSLDSTEFEAMLSDNFLYESQAVFSKLGSKKEFIDYIRPKLEAIKNAKSTVYAELAELEAYGQKDCVVLAQNSKDNLIATVYATVSNDKITRLDLCLIPDPKTAKRTGIYPSLSV